MAIEHISYMQLENLIRNWENIKSLRESLLLSIRAFNAGPDQKEVDDYIYTKVIGNKALSDTPPSGRISDTTGDTSNCYEENIKKDYSNSLKCLENERLYVEIVLDKLDIAFRRLTTVQQEIIKLFYVKEMTWAEVMEELSEQKQYITKRQAQRQRRSSIEQMQSISRISTDVYSCVIGLMEVR